MKRHRCHVRPVTPAARYRWRRMHGGPLTRFRRFLGIDR